MILGIIIVGMIISDFVDFFCRPEIENDIYMKTARDVNFGRNK